MSPSRRPRSERPAQRRPIRVVPMRGIGGLAAPAARLVAPAAAQLTYRGGPLLTAVEVVTVYWGAAWNEAAAQATAQSLNAFFQFLASSPYIDQLGEYNTPQQKIGRGRYAGTARVTDTAPGASVPVRRSAVITTARPAACFTRWSRTPIARGASPTCSRWTR